jgi:predicted DNA-binding WGR domain protein
MADSTGWRRFEFVKGGSSKFWSIRLEGSAYEVHFGRIGTAGQRKTKDFADPAAARAAYDAIVEEKLDKGYVAQEGEGADRGEDADDDHEPARSRGVCGGAPGAPIRDL